ncbi:maltose permease MAL31 (alpha glucoside transporter) [Phlyctema vagabunda]|uniref:Maltose permease MAL31 (Alpha glucoside transporter) n=1 Tax=Phlyctema vagabunda TaxID=108571 RepID=A0ABR4P2M0_9HELO
MSPDQKFDQSIDSAHIEQVETSLDEKMRGDSMALAAKDASDAEHNLTPIQAIKVYPTAVFWCLMVSMCVIMEGYDTILIGNFYAYPTFQQKYGQFFPELKNGAGAYQLTASWQAALGNGAGIGAFFGVLANGFLVNKFGQKRVLIIALFVLSAFIFMTFFASNIIILFVGELLCGLPWGVFASSAPAYASEVLPMSLRVYMTSYTNMCFIIGQLIAAGVLNGLISIKSEWSYRIPFALQWAWPALLIPILFFAPESPWHLVRHGRLEEAEHSLNRLVRKSANIDTKATLAAIVHTNELEKSLSVGTSYADCFKGTERRRTEIACMAFAGQVLSGSTFAYNSTYFFEQVGLASKTTYKLNLGGTGLALVGTFVNWFLLMPFFGRRTVYITGMFTMATILFIIGILNTRREQDSIGMAQAVLTLVWTFVFQLSAGQLGWALPAEVGSTRLRQKTVCLARNAYYIVAVVSNVLQPYFMNPTQWNLRGYTGFFWGSTAFLTFLWAYFRLPETKGRSYEEIDMLFANQVPARQFKGSQVDTFDGAVARS